jgi:hypothetical protein
MIVFDFSTKTAIFGDRTISFSIGQSLCLYLEDPDTETYSLKSIEYDVELAVTSLVYRNVNLDYIPLMSQSYDEPISRSNGLILNNSDLTSILQSSDKTSKIQLIKSYVKTSSRINPSSLLRSS